MPGSQVGNSARIMGPTTSRVQRRRLAAVEEQLVPTAITPAPPPAPATPPQPFGDLGHAPISRVAQLAAEVLGGGPMSQSVNRRGMCDLLGHLATFPGNTWGDRWAAAGLNEPGRAAPDIAGDDHKRWIRLNAAVGHLFALRVVQPSLEVFRAYRFGQYANWFRRAASDPLLEEFCRRVEQLPVGPAPQLSAKYDLCCALTVFGIGVADMTPEALLHYAVESRRLGLTRGARRRDRQFAATQVWPVLFDMGVFPPSAPRTLRAAVTRGQRSVEDLVDRYRLRNKQVRDLLVDYITRRSVSLDYSSLQQLVLNLTGLFWKTIEQINPDQTDLRLAEDTIVEWKKRLAVRPDGQPRLHLDAPLMMVRALYLDLQSWAVAEPEQWAQWVAPCPIRDTDLRWSQVRRRRVNERMADRTRQRQPLLPALVEHVTGYWRQQRELLDAARAVDRGQQFTLHGTTWRRIAGVQDLKRRDPSTAPIRVVNCDTGELVRVTHEENQAFWQWAVIETLRLAGIRAEELTELTHLSVRNYQRPNGEVIALLVISPSKSDRERVIPMSAELFHVIAQVVRRHLNEHGTVPVCIRYDLHEKIWSDPLPYLFQTLHSAGRRAMSTTTVWRMIRRAADRITQTRPEFAGVKFSPHDFRRMFATELVNSGLPIHIGAALLGHLNIQTTRGYVAVFDEDVVAHYQQFLDRRREQRPTSEYRPATPDEWTEFEQHFDKRRVELGSCGRPYGTGCAHEHACVRCPMLSVDPKMLPRLDELEDDLLARRQRAVDENWQGEIEGIDLTLTFLRGKRAQAHRLARTGPVDLGLPAMPGR